MLNAREGEAPVFTSRISLSCPASAMTYNPCFSRLDVEAYLELGDDVGSTEEGRLLKGEHGVVALYECQFACLLPCLL